ncbi:hypothetical protein J2S17_000764 [Cytobacillus purgationiresistens]|uniref:Uncharacterized protein n=2 Tax=Cytobacillus purgationiresistens TaxID=863449 RepID=A0ABU0AFM6_9BACI|nr:hypothetical protein [Cytobacillus purgationiresistens]
MVIKAEDLDFVQIEEYKDEKSVTTVICIQFKDGQMKIFEMENRR